MIVWLCVVLSQTTIASFGQMGKITGKVVDVNTQKALPFATVYINNTTIGVTTTETGEFVLSPLPIGTTEVVVSFLGYVSQRVPVIVGQDNIPSLLIRLSPDARQIAEVNIKASRDKNWEKQVRRFEKVFLGNTTSCTILNPWVLNFSEEKGRITVDALLPLEIENNQLGYKLFFQLKQGFYSATEYAFVGTTRFTELETTKPSVALNWTTARENAYQSSLKHLLKSLLDQQSYQQGFRLYRDKEKGRPRTKSFDYELEHNLVPLDTTKLVLPTSRNNEYRILVKDRLEVHYLNTVVSPNFYNDNSDAVSWLETRGGYILVSKEGTLLNSADIAVSGAIADTRIAGMLPLDYQPSSPVKLQNPMSVQARRLQESVYLHTDKPSYYPGDKVWFSAYMNYALPGLMDTLSRVLYVDLINSDRVVTQSRIIPIADGRAASSFTLPVSLAPGPYLVRAYTQWMQNYGIEHFFYKSLPVLALNQRIEEPVAKPVADELIKWQFDQPTYARRATVKMTLSLDTTGETKATKGSFSVAVIDETTIGSVPSSIKTGLVLPSLTQSPSQFTFPIEKGITIRGLYTDRRGKPKKTTVTLVPANLSSIYQTRTSDAGLFLIANVDCYDSTTFLTQPLEGKVKLVDIDPPALPKLLPVLSLHVVSTVETHPISSNDTTQIKTLKEVIVRGKQLPVSKNSYAQPDFYLKQEKLKGYASVAEAIAALLPSFKLIHDQLNWYLVWARSSMPTSKGDLASHEPSLYINDVAIVGETVGDRLLQLDPSLIDHIEANGMISANQGANGSNGLLNVYTKQTADVKDRELPTVKVRGFDYKVAFRYPDYSYIDSATAANDYRSTLYWNPVFMLSPTPTNLSFTTSDQVGRYRVIVEGILENGKPVHSETILVVHQ